MAQPLADLSQLFRDAVNSGFRESGLVRLVHDDGLGGLFDDLREYVYTVLIGLSGDKKMLETYLKARERLIFHVDVSSSDLLISKIKVGDRILFRSLFPPQAGMTEVMRAAEAYLIVASLLDRRNSEQQLFKFMGYHSPEVVSGIATTGSQLGLGKLKDLHLPTVSYASKN